MMAEGMIKALGRGEVHWQVTLQLLLLNGLTG